MGANEQAGWEQQQVNEERYREACDAINRCAKAGADTESLKTLARECGIDIKHTVLGDEIKPKEMKHAAY